MYHLIGICQVGSICAWYGHIQALTNFAEKLGRLKCQVSLPTSPPKEGICRFFQYQDSSSINEQCSQHGQCSSYSNSTDSTLPTIAFKKNTLGTRIGYDFTCAQPASQLAHKSQNEGLISADRSSKSTLLLTIPRSILSRLQRIYHKGSSSLIAGADRRALLPLVGHLARDVWGVSPYSYSPTIPRGKYCCVLAWILT